jgi:cytochrome c-type biogenesis protein CcmE
MTEPSEELPGESPDDVHVVPIAPATSVTSGRRRNRHTDEESNASRRFLFILLPIVMVGAGVAGLFLTQMKDNAIYSKPVDELLAQKAKFAGRPVRADGNLVHGTMEKRDSPCEYRFTLMKNGVELPVRYAQCVVPDTFRDVPGMDVGVTVEGSLQADNTFTATSVLAKCPSKYDMKDRAAKGEQMPHAAISSAAE